MPWYHLMFAKAKTPLPQSAITGANRRALAAATALAHVPPQATFRNRTHGTVFQPTNRLSARALRFVLLPHRQELMLHYSTPPPRRQRENTPQTRTVVGLSNKLDSELVGRKPVKRSHGQVVGTAIMDGKLLCKIVQ